MPDTDDPPRAVVVLIVGDREFSLAVVDRDTKCDLALIEQLVRLQLAAGRRGWSIRLAHVDRDFRDLLELVGLGDCLGL